MHRDYGSQGPEQGYPKEAYESEVSYPLQAGFPSERNLGCDAAGRDVAAREKYIPAELKQQAATVVHLDKLVDELAKRIEPILSQQKEITGTGAGNATKDDRPELARLLSANNYALASTTTKLERIMRRLEI